MTASANHENLTAETIRAALFSIDPDLPRDKWARMGMALKSELGDSAFGLFDEWSKTATRGYDAKECAATWKSIRQGGGVNIGTLIWEAQQNGFQLRDDQPTLDAEAVARRRAEREAEERAAAARLRKQQGEAAALANVTWNAARAADDAHPYLQGKRVRAHGLCVGEWPLVNDAGEVWKRVPDALLVPIIDVANGKVISLQGILVDWDGAIQKRYLRNGRKRGGFHMIGTPPSTGEPMAFCEGYATGATIHELTGWCVVVTFDAPNLPVVAAAMREQFPQAAFIIAADNDAFTTKQDGTPYNPGMEYARRAAQDARACIVAPQFASAEGEPTDWNDLATREGDAVAHAQLVANPVTAARAEPGTDVAGAPAANDNVDYFSPLPDVGGKGKPLATIENLAEIVDRLGVTIRYNVIGKDTEIIIPGEQFLQDTKRGASMARLKSQCIKFGMPTEPLGEYLLYLSDQRPFNPVMQWITSAPWDGRSRFRDLLGTVQLREGFEPSLWELLLRRWLVSAVAAACKPYGFWSKGVLVFQGDQSLGKTSWFRALLPDALRDLIKVDATIDPSNKDSVISAVSHWLVEIGELDGTLRKADIARLKGFISQDVDLFRRPYARTEEQFQRRTVFFASVNPEQFLADETGNVRWWTIPAVALNTLHGIDMQQLWAEVYTWFEAGERWWLLAGEEALLEARNADHAQAHPVEEMIFAKYANAPANARCEPMNATQVLLQLGYDKPTRDQQTNAAAALKKLFGKPRKTNAGRFYMVPDPDAYVDDDRPF